MSLLGSQASTMPLTSDRVEFTGEAAERISEALVSAFPTISALRRMVRIVLSSPLNHYADPSQPIQYVVLDLCTQAEACGELEKLIQGAHAQIPGNPRLKALHDEWFKPSEPRPPGGANLYDCCCLRGRKVFLDRERFRQHLSQIEEHDVKRVVVIRGERKSGKSYSAELIHFVAAQRGHKHTLIDLTYLAKAGSAVADLARRIAGTISPKAWSSDVPPQGTESRERWVYEPLVNWTKSWMQQATDTWWIIVDGFNHRVISFDVYDFLVYLGQEMDRDIENCRLILLGYDGPNPVEWSGCARRESIAPLQREHIAAFLAGVYQEHGRTADHILIDHLAGQFFRDYEAKGPNAPERYQELNDHLSEIVRDLAVSPGD